MGCDISFSDEEMRIDEGLGYPRAYAKMCNMKSLSPYSYGPPFTFTPYILQPHEALRANELDQLFPVLDPKARPTNKPKLFVSLLWKQLNHLGNAGFDPAILRVDNYGNVLYYHADSASPLSWDIDHWFPCSRGGLTVPSNLRLLQRRVCKQKHNKLEFLVPWWDFQLGISISQFLSIFASSNSDFRYRAFSLLFADGENEEVNGSQIVQSHRFPQHLKEFKQQVGLAPAAIVFSQKESHDSSTLKAIDFNRDFKPPSTSIVASRKLKAGASKENEMPLDMVTNPHQAIARARDSLKQREATAKINLEVKKLDEEVNELKRKNEEDKVTIQDLELVLIKRRRRAEKCRRLSESQSSYKTMLEKMIRDAMHKSVVYKEQVRLNQAATNALMARLEAQKAICDASEKNLLKRCKQKEEIEKQIRPEWEQERKRSTSDDTLGEETDNKSRLSVPRTRPLTPRSRADDALDENMHISRVHKELRVFLEEEQKIIDEIEEEEKKEEEKYFAKDKTECSKSVVSVAANRNSTDSKLQTAKLDDSGRRYNIRFPLRQFPIHQEPEEDEETRNERGKGNVEKWLEMLLENEEPDSSETTNKTSDNNIRDINGETKQKERQITWENSTSKAMARRSNASEMSSICKKVGSSPSFEGKRGKGGLVRSESATAFRSSPSSPSMILGMRKGVECMMKIPRVFGDDEDEGDQNRHPNENVIKSSIKMIKKTVRK